MLKKYRKKQGIHKVRGKLFDYENRNKQQALGKIQAKFC